MKISILCIAAAYTKVWVLFSFTHSWCQVCSQYSFWSVHSKHPPSLKYLADPYRQLNSRRPQDWLNTAVFMFLYLQMQITFCCFFMLFSKCTYLHVPFLKMIAANKDSHFPDCKKIINYQHLLPSLSVSFSFCLFLINLDASPFSCTAADGASIQ